MFLKVVRPKIYGRYGGFRPTIVDYGGGVLSIGKFVNLKFKNRLDEDLNPQPGAMSCCCWLCLALFWNFLSTHHRQQVFKLYR